MAEDKGPSPVITLLSWINVPVSLQENVPLRCLLMKKFLFIDGDLL